MQKARFKKIAEYLNTKHSGLYNQLKFAERKEIMREKSPHIIQFMWELSPIVANKLVDFIAKGYCLGVLGQHSAVADERCIVR